MYITLPHVSFMDNANKEHNTLWTTHFALSHQKKKGPRKLDKYDKKFVKEVFEIRKYFN